MKCKKIIKSTILTLLILLCINIVVPSYVNTMATTKENKIGVVYADAFMKNDGITPQKIKIDPKPDKEKTKEEKDKAKEAINNIEGAGKFEKIISNLIISFVCGFTSFINSQTEFSTLDNIVFNKGLSADGYSPITKADWTNMGTWFGYSIAIASFLIVIATVAIACKFFRASYNAHYKQEAKDSLVRLFIAAIIIVSTPLFVRLLMFINNQLTYLFYTFLNNGKVTLDTTLGGAKLIESLDTDSPLAAAILYGMFAILGIRINIMFLIRYFSIIVYYVLTPIVAVLWIVDKNINGAKVWLGEMLSNIFMQSAYALLFSLYLVFVGNHSWAAQLIWAILIITLADIVRNMLQGTLTKMAGMDENKKANGILGAVGATTGIVTGVAASFANQTKNVVGSIQNKNNNSSDSTTGTSTGFVGVAKKVTKGATGVVGGVAKLSSIPAVLTSDNPNATANTINRAVDGITGAANEGIDAVADITDTTTKAYKTYSGNYTNQTGYDPNKNIFENAYDSIKGQKHFNSLKKNTNATNATKVTSEVNTTNGSNQTNNYRSPNRKSSSNNYNNYRGSSRRTAPNNHNNHRNSSVPNFDSTQNRG